MNAGTVPRSSPLLLLLLQATGLVCAVELTCLSAALRSGQEPAVVALLLGAFHLGYLAAEPLRRQRHVILDGKWLAAVTVFGAISVSFLGRGCPIPVVAVAMFLFNSVAQTYRRSLKSATPVDSRTKNIAKATGMVVGGVLGAFPYAPLLLAPLALGLATSRQPVHAQSAPARESAPLTLRDRLLLWGEFVHHAHYFAYCYTFWYLAPSLIGPWTGVWFVLGWLAYFVTERIWRERSRTFAPKAIANGHLVVAGALFVMPQLTVPGVLVAWFVTGAAGGTAYMLGNAGHHGRREQYEDAGHVAGAVVAGVAALFATTHHGGAEAGVIAGACLAICTAIVFLAVPARPHDQVIQRIGETECV